MKEQKAVEINVGLNGLDSVPIRLLPIWLEREREREREEMSLELSHHKTEVCRFIWALAYVKQRRYAVRTRPR